MDYNVKEPRSVYMNVVTKTRLKSKHEPCTNSTEKARSKAIRGQGPNKYMHSFLIVSKNRQNALDYAIGECKKNKIDKFDISILSFEKSVGIEDVRNFQKKLILKPFKSTEKAVILDSFSGITIEAQNALLKLLEEPPANTIVYIISTNKELLLPTILSRCKTIELKDKTSELSKEETAEYLNILISLSTIGVGERLKLAQDIAKNKEGVIPWLERMVLVTRQQLLETYNKKPSTINHQPSTIQYLNILISLTKTYTVLKTTNVSPRLALENLFLNI